MLAGLATSTALVAGCLSDGGGSGTVGDGGNDGDDSNGGDDGADDGSKTGDGNADDDSDTDSSDDGDVRTAPDDVDAYLTENDANLYDGTLADHTGDDDDVTVAVGAGRRGYAFDPAALCIDAGTTVVWEWTSDGGAHNVASSEESDFEFRSGTPVGEAGHTYERTFDKHGTVLYHCEVHEEIGHHGAIVVERENDGDETTG